MLKITVVEYKKKGIKFLSEKLRGSASLEEEMHVQRKIKEKPQAEEKPTEG